MNGLRLGWGCVWVCCLVAVGCGTPEDPSRKPPEEDSTSQSTDSRTRSTEAAATSGSNTTGNDASVGPNSPELTGTDEQTVTTGTGTDTGATECERQIEFEIITVTAAPFDVIIVADHSPSLTWSRDDLAAGLSNLIEQVHGGQVRFFVLTPTQYGEHSQATSLMGGDIVDWKDPLTGLPYPNDMTTYVESCADFAGTPMSCPSYPPPQDVEFELTGTFELRMPEPVAAISPDMTTEELQTQQKAIADRILDLGVGGSPYEQPLCTLMRYVNQTQQMLPERAVFVVLSDEDDATSPMDCLTGVTYEQHFEPSWVTGCQADCDGTRFMVFAPYADVSQTFTCMPYDDFGTAVPEGAQEVTAHYDPVDDCSAVTVGECTPEQAATVQTFCGAGERVENCTIGCASGEVEYPCKVDLEDLTIDACQESFTLGGQSYANVTDYCQKTRPLTQWGGCTSEGLTFDQSSNINNLSANQCPVRFVASTDPLSMVSDFKTKAKDAFGDGNYFVEVIGLSPEFECPLGTGQSYATNLMQLASSADDIFPICESYAPALARIQNYAESSLRTSYPLPLSELETVGAVYVTDVSGNERQLSHDVYIHDFEASTLNLTSTALSSSDQSLRVEVEVHCVPPMRSVQ